MACIQRHYGFIYQASALILLCALGLASGQIRYSIPEEQGHGAFVGNLVTDLGLDIRKLSSRGFQITSGTNKRYLDVNQGNGVLFVNERIDRETVCELRSTCFLNLEVVIENPIEVHNIEVEILDVNDNAPTFPRSDYHLKISESSLPGARFPVESAQDPDVGTNSIRTYRLSPNEHFALDMKSLGENSKFIELVLKKSLDREQTAHHELVLTAIDGGNPPRSGTAKIVVLVIDNNDNAPRFDKSTYKVSLLENSRQGTLVIKLNATDLDEGSNGEVIYAFSSYTPNRVRQLFSIDPKTGEVRVNGSLDYEDASSYEIYVQASDKGVVSMAGHCKVLVEIIDINDNAPEIVLTSLYSPVPENALPETVVALMSVTDQDSGKNKQVSLKIPPNIPFKLKPFKSSYTLVTEGQLDRETVPAYNITVTATDNGSPPRSSNQIIFVEISDVNDNPPRFEKSSYSVYVMENNTPRASFCSVKAFDPDLNENAYVSYSIPMREIEGMPVTSYVSISADTGNISALLSFDYEKLREFQFEVEAQDAGNPSLSSTVTVNVYVVDQNDNAPEILHPSSSNGSAATEMIPRLANAGYLVTKVIAIDADSGQNAWLFYELLQATDPDLFKVNQHTGEIRTTRKLGEENTTTYSLTVLVRDNGQPPLSSSVTMNVAVVDRVAKILPDPRRHFKSSRKYSDITLYLIIALSSVSFIFLLTIIILAVIRCYRYNMYGDYCCISPCCIRKRQSVEIYKQANNNLTAILQKDFKVQPHFIEVRGNGSLSKTYCYKACLTAGSGSDTFMFYNTGGPIGPGQFVVAADRYLTGQSGQNQNLVIIGSTGSNEPKQPNTDWRYSASLRAGVQSTVLLEESGVLRGPGGPDQQWPTVSSATPEPEGGEVSPPVGAGVNSNSWTFKYGPGNPQQGCPAELPENFIIPGSPAIISIRQDQPNGPGDKSDFITFGKKEETKKKKKKKKGNKSLDKKEKGNATNENSDQ
ncbi:protocadherin alpha-C2 [Latimeria chalumnae]|uniref:protocadherin alpha-C2 n=1 Tax=Latimeria chalumnae TaxID=7897 RepID=UPI0006D9343B|nr:PREDICTED: protocadherin alpha-C2 [Latimeria chalumnae]|eukprot:XP_014351003.1 PREDICTED: protocadherin alpha-C2 [Latimeria chalumnae]